MNHTADSIDASGEYIEKRRIAILIVSSHGMSDQIRILDHTRRLRIHEEWNIGQII